MPIARTWFVRALVSMPRRFMAMNSSAKNTTHAGYGTTGRKLIAALLHQIVQIAGLST